MNTPVLFNVFNRPETTSRVFAAIRAARPEQLFIASDGPRDKRDLIKCTVVRQIVSQVDWKCEVQTLFRKYNAGCRVALSGNIDWFFEQVPEGIILEDDCLPSPDFFRFAAAALAAYREVPQVMHVAGVNFQQGVRRGDSDAFFMRTPHIWGWATWRRAWRHYDVEMRDFRETVKTPEFQAVLPKLPHFRRQLLKMFSQTAIGNPNFNTWDCQWHYTVLKSGGVSVNPQVNLVSNIGMTSTHQVDEGLCNRDFGTLPDELNLPREIVCNQEAENLTGCLCYRESWREYLAWLLKYRYAVGK